MSNVLAFCAPGAAPPAPEAENQRDQEGIAKDPRHGQTTYTPSNAADRDTWGIPAAATSGGSAQARAHNARTREARATRPPEADAHESAPTHARVARDSTARQERRAAEAATHAREQEAWQADYWAERTAQDTAQVAREPEGFRAMEAAKRERERADDRTLCAAELPALLAAYTEALRRRPGEAVTVWLMQALSQGMAPAVIRFALDAAADARVPSWAYAQEVARRCWREGCRTASDCLSRAAQYREARAEAERQRHQRPPRGRRP